MSNVNGEETPKGRGNIIPVTINLPQLAIKSMKETKAGDNVIDTYFAKLQDMLELCERQLMNRYEVLCKLKGVDLPFVISEHLMMGSENIGLDDSIEPILKQGSYGIGFIGLAETLIILTGHHHGESQSSWDLGYNIIKTIREFCDEMTVKHQLNFTCYGSPAEGVSGRFPEIDKKKYGVIKGVTDKDYYTNSFH